MKKGQHAIIFSGMLIALLAVAIPFGSESFAKPDKCDEWPDCPGKGGGGGGGKTAFDFTLDLSSSFISIEQGSSDNILVTVSQPSGNGNVNLSASNIPAGVTVSFDQTNSKISPNNPPFTSTMTIVVSSTGSAGTIDVHASAKGTTKTSTLTLDVSDNIAPQTTINSKPSNPSSDANPIFTFSANEPSTFECKLDGGSFVACTSGDSFGPLADGSHTFYVSATDSAGNLDLSPASNTWTVDTSLPTPPSPVIVAAGDIACDPLSSSYNGGAGTATLCHQMHTSDIIESINPTAVLTLGDNQYEDGVYSNFLVSYEPSWGRMKSITYPSPGNHDYHVTGAEGYFDYFGAAAGDPAKGYYSFDIGAWHLISLNSNCSDVSCSATSAQVQWLDDDLTSNTSQCTLAYWHHPKFSSGTHGNSARSDAFWDTLYAHNADVVLVGHDHNYERFNPQDPGANADPTGITEFVVGTGGKSVRTLDILKANSASFDSDTFGVLKLTLNDSSYDWEFVGESGSTFTDSGTGFCN